MADPAPFRSFSFLDLMVPSHVLSNTENVTLCIRFGWGKRSIDTSWFYVGLNLIIIKDGLVSQTLSLSDIYLPPPILSLLDRWSVVGSPTFSCSEDISNYLNSFLIS